MTDQDKLSLSRALDVMTEARKLARKELVGYFDLSQTNNIEGIAVVFIDPTVTANPHTATIIFKFSLNKIKYEIPVDLSLLDVKQLAQNQKFAELGMLLYTKFSECLATELLKAVQGDLNLIVGKL